MYCSRCGCKVPGGTAVCPECGKDLSYESTASRKQPKHRERGSRGFRLGPLVPFFLILLLAEAVFLIGIAPGRVRESADAQTVAAGNTASSGIRELIPTYTPEATAEVKPTERPEPTPTATVTPRPDAAKPTAAPTPAATTTPTAAPTPTPTAAPTPTPTAAPTPTPTAAPTPAPETGDEVEEAIPLGTGYIIPDSATRRLTEADLRPLDAASIRIARNEIYARHGLIFKSADLRAYFESKDWYSGTVKDAAQITLSEVEAANVSFINDYEAKHNLNQ